MSAAGERTEQPTPKRLRDARGRGEVARSADLVAACALGGGGLALAGLLPGAAAQLLGLSRRLWQTPGVEPSAALLEAARTALTASLPLVVVVAAVSVLAAFAQTGPVLAVEAIRPDPRRLDPAKGFKRLFSFQRLGVVLKAALALTVALAAARFVLRAHATDVLRLPLAGAVATGAVLAALLPRLVAVSGAALLLLGAADLLLARRRLAKELRMTRQEVKEEHKSQEGSPEHKGRRRQAHHELLASPARPLKEAEVVVVNPTHVAVALHFTDEMDVPEVGVRGVGDDAARIRAEARRLGLPLVRDVPLARALLAVDPGAPVPEPLYAAVAAVLAAVHRARLAARTPERSTP